jgi:hypothetical protein
MARKTKQEEFEFDISAILSEAIRDSVNEISAGHTTTGYLNIIDFAKHFLNLDFEDRPYLKLLLKLWYSNTPGNEDLEITDEDIDLIDKIENYGFGNPWLKVKALKIKNGQLKTPFKYMIAVLGRRSGKAQPLNSKILTPTGWKFMGDIAVGDLVITQDGSVSHVTGVYPQGKKKIYKITMSDKSKTECCEEHLWFTHTKSDRKNRDGKRCLKTQHKYEGSVKSTKSIMETLMYDRKDGKKERNHQIPMVCPVNFESNSVPIDPYLLGLLLGDGSLSANYVGFSSGDQELIDSFSDNLQKDLEIVHRSKYDYTIVKKSRRKSFIDTITKNKSQKNPIIEKIKELNLYHKKSHEKFIPEIYKINSKQIRIDILQGLLDSDGTVDRKCGKISFSTVSEKLADDVKFIVQSIGGIATINEVYKYYTYNGERKRGRKTYSLQIKLPSVISPFRLKRKANIYAEFVGTMHEPKRFIDSIEYVGEKEAQCISISHPSHLYVTDDFIVTHNTFLASVINCYDIYKLVMMNVCPKCEDISCRKSGEPCERCGETTKKHPQTYFGMTGTEPLRFILSATAIEQAKDPGLKLLQERIMMCPLLDGTYEDNIQEEYMFFKTGFDNERNERFRKAAKRNVTKGSIFARAVAVNSRGLHGLSAVSVLFDEYGLFSLERSAKGTPQDDELWEALIPQTTQFEVKHPEFGRVMMMSAPQYKFGRFYRSYLTAKDTTDRGDQYLMIQMPTWEWYPKYTRDLLYRQFETEPQGEGISFDKVYGAQFVDDSEQIYIPEVAIDRAFENEELKLCEFPTDRRRDRYMHIDCAYNTCNYAYCVIHIEPLWSKVTEKIENFFVQDDGYFWTPSPNYPDKFVDIDGKVVDIQEINEKIVKVAKNFNVRSLSFDNMQSVESKSLFRRRGLPLRQLSYSGREKTKIYGVLKNAFIEGRVACCNNDYRLKNELLGLRSRPTERGPKIYPDPNGTVKMDCADCLAGACFMATEKTTRKFAGTSVFHMPINGSGNKLHAGQSIFIRELPNIQTYGGG